MSAPRYLPKQAKPVARCMNGVTAISPGSTPPRPHFCRVIETDRLRAINKSDTITDPMPLWGKDGVQRLESKAKLIAHSARNRYIKRWHEIPG